MRNRSLRGLIPALVLAVLPAISSAGVFLGISVNLAPPPLPVYVQPPCPQPGYIWSPGYWAWNDGAYYWVPGTWVLPPEVGLLWTPGYWGWQEGVYFWHPGYWGPHVGFYGGVNYGFGYDGVGFNGGYWRGNRFFYNRAVAHVGPTFVTNVYYRQAPAYRGAYQHVSFNGGPGGVVAHASRAQLAAAHERHFAFTGVQQRQQRMAFANRTLRADYNHGRPPIAATARAAVFRGNGVTAARAAGGPVRNAPARAAAMRSDRPSWASGQPGARNRAGHPAERAAPVRAAQAGYGRQPQQRFEQRPQARPRAQQYRQSYRPQGQRAPAARRQQAPRQQQRGGGGGHRPQQDHGGHDRR